MCYMNNHLCDNLKFIKKKKIGIDTKIKTIERESKNIVSFKEKVVTKYVLYKYYLHDLNMNMGPEEAPSNIRNNNNTMVFSGRIFI